MSDELTTTVELPHNSVPLPFRHRVRHGVRRPHNWFQLGRFVAVGASGYVVNLAVFAVCVHLLAINYKIAAVIAFVLSVLNNFWWNRHWTFDAKEAHAVHQGARFFAVSLIAFGFTYALLISSRRGRRHAEGRRAGDLDRRRHAAVVRRPEALELPRVRGRRPGRALPLIIRRWLPAFAAALACCSPRLPPPGRGADHAAPAGAPVLITNQTSRRPATG